MTEPTTAEILALWDFSNPAGTETKFRELLPRTEPGSSIRLELQTQIARTLGLQRKFDEAHTLLDEIKPALKTAPGVVEVRYLLERGRVFNSAGNPDAARPLFIRAWDVAREAGEDGLAVDAAHMVAIVEPPEQALEWNRKAIAFAEQSSDPTAKKWLGSLYNNTGWTYHDQGKYDLALDQFQKALAFFEKQGTPRPIGIAKWCVARTLRSLNRLDEALAAQQALLKEHEQAGSTDGYVFEELGECHLALGHADEATPFFARAYEELSKDEWFAKAEPQRLERLKRLGDGPTPLSP